MVFDIKPKIDRYIPFELESGMFAVSDTKTGELVRKKEGYRILTFAFKSWAQHECNKLNRIEEKKQCKD